MFIGVEFNGGVLCVVHPGRSYSVTANEERQNKSRTGGRYRNGQYRMPETRRPRRAAEGRVVRAWW